MVEIRLESSLMELFNGVRIESSILFRCDPIGALRLLLESIVLEELLCVRLEGFSLALLPTLFFRMDFLSCETMIRIGERGVPVASEVVEEAGLVWPLKGVGGSPFEVVRKCVL